MSHEFELHKEIPLDATPDQVWEAIATGPGVDSWFMGRSEVEPREGGAASLTVAGQTERATITGWEPGRRLAMQVAGPDGQPGMAIEYLIEARGGSASVMRLVQSGMLEGDWESEFEAMKTGWDMYLHTLAIYLRHFPGRHAVPVTLMRPDAGAFETTWPALTQALSLRGPVSPADRARVILPDGAEVHGEVDFYDESGIVGVRSADGLYRFMHSGAKRGNVLFVAHHLFGDVDAATAERNWQAWMESVATDRSPSTAG